MNNATSNNTRKTRRSSRAARGGVFFARRLFASKMNF
jgi:hypothetical protein